MAAEFALTIQTPGKTVYKGQASSLLLSTETGEMEVLPGHAALAGTLGFTKARLREGSHEEAFYLRQGFVFVDGDRVRVLAYAADRLGELDRQTAKQYLDTVLAALERKEDLSKYQIDFLEEQKIVFGDMAERLPDASK